MRINSFDKEPEVHPSYGVMGFSRTTGTPRPLFGSSIKHDQTITLRISHGKLYRDFQKNRYMDGNQIIEVEMSSAQFAEAITTLNIGSGVPVTLRFIAGTGDIENPPEVNFRERAKNELKAEMGELAERINELAKDTKEILESKGTITAAGKKKLLQDLEFLVQEVRGNIPFAHECFQEAVEETVVDAKAEIDATLMAYKEQLADKVIESGLDKPLLKDANE